MVTYVWAAEPTRDTERPTLMAGRTPRKNSSDSKKTWPSVIEITFVGLSYPSDHDQEGKTEGVHISRHVSSLGLNNGQGSERSSPKVIVHLGCTLQ
jgi:hypothetical protein